MVVSLAGKKMKKKIVAMIPARMGSKRVYKKNLRMLGNKPLISHITETAVKSNLFDEVYINSEDDIFESIAKDCGAKFFHRPAELAQDSTNNDQFLTHFCEHTDAEIVFQLLPTSPFVTIQELTNFVDQMLQGKLDTLISTVEHQIACVNGDEPINFSRLEPHIPSQDMSPISSYATVLMGWHRKTYLEHISRLGFGYHGGDGKVGYFPLKGFSTVDIDNEEDFLFAESVVAHLSKKNSNDEIQYYERKEKQHEEADVPSILKIDGINISDFEHENLPLTNIEEIIAGMDNSKSWCYRVVNSVSNSATVISQLPGEGNRRHYHPDWNEWWYILGGEWQWDIEDKQMIVKQGDIVFIEKNKWHKITAIGNKPAIRLAVSRADVIHTYDVE